MNSLVLLSCIALAAIVALPHVANAGLFDIITAPLEIITKPITNLLPSVEWDPSQELLPSIEWHPTIGWQSYDDKHPETKPPQISTGVTASGSYCPNGWGYYDNSCYYFAPAAFPWQEAEAYCEADYSHLASIRNYGEQQYLSSAGGDWWIGLTRYNGQFVWTDNHPVTVAYFNGGQPDGSGNCVSIAGLWYDENCNSPKNFICRWDPQY